MITTIEERTTAEQRHDGFRSLVIHVEKPGFSFMPPARHMICVTTYMHEDISLDGEAPNFTSLPDNVIANEELARALSLASASLLNHPQSKLLHLP